MSDGPKYQHVTYGWSVPVGFVKRLEGENYKRLVDGLRIIRPWEWYPVDAQTAIVPLSNDGDSAYVAGMISEDV